MGAEADFEIAIARADAQEALRIVLPGLALLRKIFPEHPVRTAESERFELRPHIAVRPEVKNIGQLVNFHAIPIGALLSGETRSVGGRFCAGSQWIVHLSRIVDALLFPRYHCAHARARALTVFIACLTLLRLCESLLRILAQLFRYGLDHPAELLQVESVRDVAFIVKPNVSGAVDQIELREGLRFIKLFDAAIAEENREIVSSLFCKLGGVSFVGIRADSQHREIIRFISVLLPGHLPLIEFGYAGAAPGCPQRDRHNFAAQIIERDRTPTRVFKAELQGGAALGGRKQRRAHLL